MIVVTLSLGIASISGGLAILAHTERVIAQAHLRAVQTTYAAEMAAVLGVSAVSLAPGSAVWPITGGTGALSGGATSMAVAAGETVDLDARTAELNRDAARLWPLGVNTPRWRLMAWGRLSTLPPGTAASAPRVAVWIADDVMDRDGRPDEDQNGVLMIRAEAFGPGGAARAIVVHVVREAGRVRTLSWRDVSLKEA
jgi:hypothetical protein